MKMKILTHFQEEGRARLVEAFGNCGEAGGAYHQSSSYKGTHRHIWVMFEIKVFLAETTHIYLFTPTPVLSLSKDDDHP